ncbi:MAG: neutral zinc metallopeptidase [Solirubrobacterales bacterium]
MKWKRTNNPDVIDQRGARGGGGGIGSSQSGFPFPGGGAGKGVGGLGLVGIVVFVLLQFVLGGSGGGSGIEIPGAFGSAPAPGTENPSPIPAGKDPQADLKDFSSFVFTDVQSVWQETFRAQGKPYEHAKLVLYSGAVDTGCGSATSAVGPFYCPADQHVYLDLSFYDDMAKQLQAPGDFAWAYVIAHEMGHHIQQQVGTSDEVQREQQSDPSKANEISVRLELQADCYAGVWAKTAFAAGELEQGDIAEAQTAASSVGDDRLAKSAGRDVSPENFTHGTSAQRQRWFQTGYDSGEPGTCDTFSPDEP